MVLNQMIDIINLINWKNFTVNALISYGLAWGFFFITLSLFQKIFGKSIGFAFNYLVSWGIMIILFYALTKFNPVGDHSQIISLIKH